jgi:hypothetical protein
VGRLGHEWLVSAWLGPPNAKSVDAQCGVSAAFAVVGTIRLLRPGCLTGARFDGTDHRAALSTATLCRVRRSIALRQALAIGRRVGQADGAPRVVGLPAVYGNGSDGG